MWARLRGQACSQCEPQPSASLVGPSFAASVSVVAQCVGEWTRGCQQCVASAVGPGVAGVGQLGRAICGSVAPSPSFCRACWAPAAGALSLTGLGDHNWCGGSPSHPTHHCCLLLLPPPALPFCARRPHADLNAWLAQHSAQRSAAEHTQSVTTDPLQQQSLFDPHQQDGPAAGTPPCGSGFGDSDSTGCCQQLHSPHRL